jgi:hypothetical protein
VHHAGRHLFLLLAQQQRRHRGQADIARNAVIDPGKLLHLLRSLVNKLQGLAEAGAFISKAVEEFLYAAFDGGIRFCSLLNSFIRPSDATVPATPSLSPQ